MAKAMYIVGLTLGLFAGQAVIAAAAESETVQHLRKAYPILSATRDRYNRGYPLIDWGNSTKKNDASESLLINILAMTIQGNPTKDAFRELEAFMKEYSSALNEQTVHAYYDFYRGSILESLKKDDK